MIPFHNLGALVVIKAITLFAGKMKGMRTFSCFSFGYHGHVHTLESHTVLSLDLKIGRYYYYFLN